MFLKMVQNQTSPSEETYHTWESFQAKEMTPPKREQQHVWAAPPATKPYTTQCGVKTNVPDIR